jgi:hypothetical protein
MKPLLTDRQERLLAATAALALALGALVFAPRTGAWRFFGHTRLLAPLSARPFPTLVPLVACLLGALAICASAGFKLYASRRALTAVVMAALLPAVAAFVEAFRLSRAGDERFCSSQLGFLDTSIAIASSLEEQVAIVAEGTLRSASLLALLALFAMPWRSDGSTRDRFFALSATGAVALAVGARFVHGGEVSVLDLLPPLVLALCVIAIGAAFRSGDKTVRSIAWVAVAGLLLMEVGVIAEATAAALAPLAHQGLSRADVARLSSATLARERFRSFMAFVDFAVVATFAIIARHRTRNEGSAGTGTARASELLVGGAAVAVVALVGGTSLHWAGGTQRLRMVDAAVARLSLGAAPSASDFGTSSCLPRDLSAPGLSIDRTGALRVLPRIGREPERGDASGPPSPLLVVAESVSLGRVIEVLGPRIAAGETAYRWAFAKVPPAQREHGFLAPLHQLRGTEFSSFEFEPHVRIVSDPADDATSRESRDCRLGMLVAPGGFPSESSNAEETTRVVPLARSSTGLHVDGDYTTWPKEAACVHCDSPIDAVIAFLPHETRTAGIQRVAETLAEARETRSFSRVALSAARETIEADLETAVTQFSSKRQTACVEAARQANESSKTREAFDNVLRQNPRISRDSLEFVAGALILSGSGHFDEVKRVHDCAEVRSGRCEEDGEFVVDYGLRGVAVNKRSGAVRGTWHLNPSPGHAPPIRLGAIKVVGHFEPDPTSEQIANPVDLVRRIVRLSFKQLRQCYVSALSTNPDLQGRVTVRFTIDKDGKVSRAKNVGQEMPDANVVRCVVRSFSELTFPRPAKGEVTVVSPINFMTR